MIDLYILIVLLIIGFVFGLFYFKIRDRMTEELHRDLPISYFTKRRIKKLFLLVMFALIVSFVISILLILGIKLRAHSNLYSSLEVVVLIFYTFSWMIISSGIGLYVSGIFIEQYSMEHLRHMPEYSRLKVATKLLHGQISHICIFSGGMAALFSIAIFELFNQTSILGSEYYILYSITGILFGMVYYWGQIKNLTWKHQMPFFTLIFILDICLLITGLNLLLFPFNLFFFFFSTTSTIGLIFHSLKRKILKLL